MIWKPTDNAAPALNELYGRRAISQFTSAYLRLLRYSLLQAIPLAIGLLGFNRNAITLWVGQAQYAGFLLTAALAAVAVTRVIGHLNAIVMVAYGDVRVMSIWSLCGGIVRVILAFWLGRIIGLAGVMIANVVVGVPGLVYFNYRVWRLLGLPVRQVWRHAVAPALRANTLTLLVLIAVLVQPPPATWPWFFLWASIFALAWAIGVGGVGVLPAERDKLRLYVKHVLGLAAAKTSGL